MYLDNKIIKEDMESIYNRDIDWTVLDGKTIFVSGAYGMITSYIVYFLMYLNIQYGINVRVIAQGRNKEKAFGRFNEIWRMLSNLAILTYANQLNWKTKLII